MANRWQSAVDHKLDMKIGGRNEGMTFRIVLEFDPEANCYSAMCP